MAAPIDIQAVFTSSASQGVPKAFPFTFHHFSNRFLEVNSLNEDATGFILFHMTYAMRFICQIPGVPAGANPNDDTGADHGSNKQSDPIYCNGVESVDAITGIQASRLVQEEKAVARLFFNCRDPAVTILRDLCACAQTSSLSVDNVENYLLSLNSESLNCREILSVVNASCGKFANIFNAYPATEDWKQSTFIKYHTSASSTPQLVQRVIADLGNLGTSIFTQGEIDAVTAAIQAPNDLAVSQAIPARAVAVASAYLEAFDALPKGWYQGKKAVALSSPAMYSAYITLFSKWGSLAFRTDIIKKAKHPDRMIAALPASLFAGGVDQSITASAQAEEANLRAELAIIDAGRLAEINARRAAQTPPLPDLPALPYGKRATVEDIIDRLNP